MAKVVVKQNPEKEVATEVLSNLTRAEAIRKIEIYLVKHGAESEANNKTHARIAFIGNSPLRGSLLMLEALGIIGFLPEPPDV